MVTKKLAKAWLEHTGLKKDCYDPDELCDFLLGEPCVVKAAHKAVKGMTPKKFVRWTARLLSSGDDELPL